MRARTDYSPERQLHIFAVEQNRIKDVVFCAFECTCLIVRPSTVLIMKDVISICNEFVFMNEQNAISDCTRNGIV
jgi:hypothetical protein